jgi:hypothetical protein
MPPSVPVLDAAAGTGDVPASQPPGLLDRLSGRQRTGIALGVLLLAFAVPLYGELRNQGPPMEEGFMLVFPEMVMEGLVPNKDFLHLYGPGSLWVLAGVFEVFGVSLTAQRLVGLAQHVGLVLAVFAVARLWSRSLALLCALIALLIIVPPTGLTALAWVGAVAFGLWAVHLGLRSRHAIDDRWAGRAALGAGLLAGPASSTDRTSWSPSPWQPSPSSGGWRPSGSDGWPSASPSACRPTSSTSRWQASALRSRGW